MKTEGISLSEPERYADMAGWEPKNPYEKQIAKAKIAYEKEQKLRPMADDSMLGIKAANRWRTRYVERKPVSDELFTSIWHEGEVAVLLGEKNVGKSILAVQLAESIARGRTILSEPGAPVSAARTSRTPHSAIRTRKVLYLDFQRTQRQWQDRYSAPSPHLGKLPERYRFSPNLIRAAIDWDGWLPNAFKGDIGKFLEHSIHNALLDSGAKIVIIDDLSYISRITACPTERSA